MKSTYSGNVYINMLCLRIRTQVMLSQTNKCQRAVKMRRLATRSRRLQRLRRLTRKQERNAQPWAHAWRWSECRHTWRVTRRHHRSRAVRSTARRPSSRRYRQRSSCWRSTCSRNPLPRWANVVAPRYYLPASLAPASLPSDPWDSRHFDPHDRRSNWRPEQTW